MLHLVSETRILNALSGRVASGDALVLQQTAVWAALAGGTEAELINKLLVQPVSCYVLRDMLIINGIAEPDLIQEIQVIDYAGLVQLTEQHATIQTWS